ncbi:MAG: hypothetical protein UT29_C0004G0020 [Candidatus Yanofskybacteria bacterium GW2011_GWA1_39_13]|uniref:Uncharacterized protein n=1 Tax=Yanofskybacteria sp. (strain GW2011_GWA1_39_13) TaxID=1619019 RepID=A0A0G0QKW5_YANXG|nr:MAG: hypothetical protein UT29_C0004G0020 [Candidatus Yanofskybacteria bacterium GW2011_GWA1_39_13]
MIFKAPGQPTTLKHVAYLITATFFGLILSFIIHALIEMGYLRWADSQGLLVPFYGGCALTPTIQIGIWVVGAVGGFLLGRFGWRKVYVERIWEK